MSDYGNLPVDLVFVRHGESEGNLAEELSWKGDESHYEVPRLHSSFADESCNL